MKTRLFILIGIIAFAMTSCDMNGSSNSTPQILFVTSPIANKTDTLNRYLTDVAGIIRLDTIQVGDTVTFRMLFWGFSNNLSVCNVIQSDTSSTKLLFPAKISLDSIFLASASDYANGKFVFKNKIQSLYFPFRYVAKKASSDAKISFYLSSDADFSSSSSYGNNSMSVVLRTPIRLPKPLSVNKQ
ncbi:MAG: hypothetical protein PHT07_19520 [Paludibacter sp.]|nr:hypothetical protein [Paludibacter sp.]